MKKILIASAAILAVAAVSAPAAAQTNQRQYATPLPFPAPFDSLEINNPSNVNPIIFGIPLPSLQDVADFAVENLNIGTRYTAVANAPADSEVATPVVTVAFTLTGTVNRDCSFYAGNNAAATNIDFGVIGVRTGDNENVNNAFEMVGPATAAIETLTAGCNFNNTVSITKDNVLGMVNAVPGGYDTDEFQANIPYSVSARWTGVAQNTVTNGTGQELEVATNVLSNQLTQGAWRSNMEIDIVAPAIAAKGLVAGDYTGTTTLVLEAL